MRVKNLLLCSVAIIGFVTTAKSQKNEAPPEIKYRRSSLDVMLIESDKFPKKDTVIAAFNNAPFPDKYNDQSIGEKTFNPKDYPLTNEEKEKINKGKAKPGSSNNQNDISAKELPFQIEKYFIKNKIANKLVAKWFNRQPDGTMDMNLVGQRGSYNASQMEAEIAKKSARGTASLKDAGVELIGNTFVVISKFNFVPNEIAARIARDASKASAQKLPVGKEAAIQAADLIYEKAKEGYSVWATSYLYKLVWNDSIDAVFYNELWMDKSNIDPKRKEAFDNAKFFRLEYIGDASATGLVLFSLKEKRSEEKIVQIATIRTIDAVYAKLQKEYDVFKPKVPLFSGDPITAKIGMKESIEAGDKFEVLEQTVNEKTGLTEYISKGTIKVEKDKIWDNRYDAENEPVVDGTPAKPVLNCTTFSGGKKFYQGMLIKQIK